MTQENYGKSFLYTHRQDLLQPAGHLERVEQCAKHVSQNSSILFDRRITFYLNAVTFLSMQINIFKSYKQLKLTIRFY